MARGRKAKPGGLRPDQRKPGKILETDEDRVIPPMPDAANWAPPQGPAEETEPGFEPEWRQPVIDWWDSIWSSPMASEFVESDVYGLYMGCVYLQESLNPYLKVADRIKNAQAWEKVVKDFGLQPSARESLRWQVAQGTQAQNRTDQIRQQKNVENKYKAAKANDPQGKIHDLYGQFG